MKTNQATAEVFFTAFKALRSNGKKVFLEYEYGTFLVYFGLSLVILNIYMGGLLAMELCVPVAATALTSFSKIIT